MSVTFYQTTRRHIPEDDTLKIVSEFLNVQITNALGIGPDVYAAFVWKLIP
jgi:hypothetical protein